jgi:thioredoxin 1
MDEVSVVKFGAPWCGPCRACLPEFQQLARAFPSVTFEDVDIDTERIRAMNSKIATIPTFVIFCGGEEVTRVVGAHVDLVEAALGDLVVSRQGEGTLTDKP